MTEILAVGREVERGKKEFPGLGDWVTCGTIHKVSKAARRIRFMDPRSKE